MIHGPLEPPLQGLSKQEIRRLVWRRLVEAGVARPPFPVEGRIPNFAGAERAAERIAGLEEWRRARVLKVNPDSPQRPVRLRALREGKLVLMATPRIRKGFLLLDPSRIPSSQLSRASTIRGAFRYGLPLPTVSSLLRVVEKVDMIVEGSVAVSIYGDRLGKGHGYGDLEYGILTSLGLAGDKTPIATSVHDLQVFKQRLPQDPHDVPVDIIATPTRLVRAEEARRRRPRGIIWSVLDDRKIAEIPLLRELREVAGRDG